jgi:rubrerythrin
LRDLNLALLAPGHPRKRARTAREQASALRLEALALRNQARHQQKRAARVAAGLAPLTELVEATCRTCGYIVRAERLPAVCPVCQSMDWQSSETDESPVRDSSNPA